MESKSYNIVLSALLLSIGVLLPIAFHMFNLGGNIFLPMHIPVLIAGFLLPWQYAGAVGAITPLLSFLLTSMPPIPSVFAMVFELFTYAVIISLTFRRFKWTIYPSLLISMVLGRIVSILGNWIIAILITHKVFNLVKFTSSLFVLALPGIIIQLIFIPIIVRIVISNKEKTTVRFF